MAKEEPACVSLPTPSSSVAIHEENDRVNRIIDWLHTGKPPASDSSYPPLQTTKRPRAVALESGYPMSHKRQRRDEENSPEDADPTLGSIELNPQLLPTASPSALPYTSPSHSSNGSYILEDADPTPRPNRFTHPHPTTAPIPWLNDSSSQSSHASTSQDPSSIDSKSLRRKASPKKSATLRYLMHAIDVRQLDFGHLENVPVDAQSMLRVVRKYAKGHGIITKDQKDELLEFSQDPDLKEDLVHMVDDITRETFGRTPMPITLTDVLDRAQEAHDEGQSELAWNMSVHYPLLSIAAKTSSYAGSSALRAATHARIIPTLLPMNPNKTRSDGHMIDLVLALHLPPSIIDLARKSYAYGHITSLNQTEYTPLRYRPLSISIETKLPGDDWDKGQTQLGVWVRAQYAKLEQMMQLAAITTTASNETSNTKDTVAALPALPLLLIQGHEWNLLVAFKEDDKIVLLSKILFGTTASYEGIYRILAVVHFLLHWAETSLRPWWYANILTPLYGAVA